jgi:RND family efflux transporter MFP subunit
MRVRKIIAGCAVILSNAVNADFSTVADQHLDCLIEPNQTIELGSPVPGVIQNILVDRADTIEAGQALVQLESSVEEASSRQARERASMDGTVKARRADMHLARQNMQRMEKLFERKMVSSQQRDEARAEFEVARRNYQVAQENQRLAQLEFETTQAKLSRRVIRSPIDGVVVSRLSMPGEFVDERPLLSLAQLDPLRVEVLMPAALFGSVVPGMRAEVHPEIATSKTLTAEVSTVDRLIDAASGTFRVRLALPNPEQKIPGGLKCGVRFMPMPVVAQEHATPSEQTLPETAAIDTVEQKTNVAEKASQETPAQVTTATESAPVGTAKEEQAVASEPYNAPLPMVASLLPDHRQCATIGEFKTRPAAEKLAAELEAAGIDVALHTRQRQVLLDYAVKSTVPPGERGDFLRNLKAAGFADVASYVSSKTGETIISAGLYAKLKRAEQRQAQLAQKGFELEVHPRYKEANIYTLSVMADSQQKITRLLDELSLKEQPKLSETMLCNEVLASQHETTAQLR